MEQNIKRGKTIKKWKWPIILVISLVAAVVGFSFWPPLHEPNPIGLLAIIFGLYWAGYAASRLEANMRDMKFKVHVEVKGWKPHITVTPLGE